MILSDAGIKEAIRSGRLKISPEPDANQYTTSAVDLTLGSDFMTWDQDKLGVEGFTPILDLSKHKFGITADAFLKKLPLENDGSFVLRPYAEVRQPVLAMTREKVHLKPGSLLAARVEGRSSLARLGLMVHLTAPTIHANFNAGITLEMVNHGPFNLKLIPGSTRICQLYSRVLTDCA